MPTTPTTTMALRNDEKEWVKTQIEEGIGALRPRGWRKAVSVLRELGPLITIIAVVLTLVGITLDRFTTRSAGCRNRLNFGRTLPTGSQL